MSFQAAGGGFPAPAPGGGMFPSPVPAAVATSGIYQTGTMPPGGGMYPSGTPPRSGMFPVAGPPGMMPPNPPFPAMRPMVSMGQPGILPMPPVPPGGKIFYEISHIYLPPLINVSLHTVMMQMPPALRPTVCTYTTCNSDTACRKNGSFFLHSR